MASMSVARKAVGFFFFFLDVKLISRLLNRISVKGKLNVRCSSHDIVLSFSVTVYYIWRIYHSSDHVAIITLSKNVIMACIM